MLCYGIFQESRCRLEILRGFINEIKILLQLRDSPSVIKVSINLLSQITGNKYITSARKFQLISYCIPHHPLKNLGSVSILTERGTPVDLFSLLQLSLSQRDRLFEALRSFFAENPTLRLHDFRRQQVGLKDVSPSVKLNFISNNL